MLKLDTQEKISLPAT